MRPKTSGQDGKRALPSLPLSGSTRGPLTEELLSQMWKNAYLTVEQFRRSTFAMPAEIRQLLPSHASGANTNASSQKKPTMTDPASTAVTQLRQFVLAQHEGTVTLTPPPKLPPLVAESKKQPLSAKLQHVQLYISRLGYNFTGVPFFYAIKKKWPYRILMDTARQMTTYALPIKCLEAVVLAMYLTNSMRECKRFPIIFHSSCGPQVYKHIVLGIYHDDLFGSLGLSRRSDLMDKPLCFQSLHELISDYKCAYEKNGHTLLRCFVGLPVPHEVSSSQVLTWRSLHFELDSPFEELLYKFTREKLH